MSLILVIDTSGENAFVCLSAEGKLLAIQESREQNQHASFIHVAITDLFKGLPISLEKIDAVSVVNGPGSYTGLRVGLSTAKGLCFALQKPLILLNTLKMMAKCIRNNYMATNDQKGNELFCPLIDARRAEVFTGIYNTEIEEVLSNTNLIIDESTFGEYADNHLIIFGGNACTKVEKVLQNKNCIYFPHLSYSKEACVEAEILFENKEFASLIYAEPYYLKEFYTISPKKSINT